MVYYQVHRVARKADVDAADVISLADAARIRGCAVQVISTMVQTGTLPWIQRTDDMDAGATRFTLRSVVEALPAKRTGGTRKR